MLDGRILFFKQFDDECYFSFTFTIGYNTINIIQIGEDKFDLLIDGRRFTDLMANERAEKNNLQKKLQREKR